MLVWKLSLPSQAAVHPHRIFFRESKRNRMQYEYESEREPRSILQVPQRTGVSHWRDFSKRPSPLLKAQRVEGPTSQGCSPSNTTQSCHFMSDLQDFLLRS